MEKIKYIHKPTENEPFVVVYKEKGIPSAPLFENDESVVTIVKNDFPEIMKVSGKKTVEGGLLHRLDTQTDGLLLIATEQSFYDDLILQQKNGEFIKFYKANCDFVENYSDLTEGFSKKNIPFDKEICVTSKFRYFGKNNSEVRPVTEESGRAALKKCSPKEYSTFITISKSDNNYTAKCHIKEGFKHQVRCHLAWCGFPVKNDKTYNLQKNLTDSLMEFSAYKIQFKNNVTGKVEIFEI